METTTTLPYSELQLAGAGFTNPRKLIDDDDIVDLGQNILAHGLLQPLLVWSTVNEDGASIYVVVDGSRRHRGIGTLASNKKAAELLAAVPVHIVEAKSLTEARIKGLSAQVQRKELTSYELACAVDELVKDGVKQKDVADQLNKSATWVSRQLSAIRSASEPVLKAWESGKLPDDDVQHLASIKAVNEKTGKPSKKPDHAEQNKQLEKILAKRVNGTRSDRGAARAIAKATKKASGAKSTGDSQPRMLRPSPDVLERYHEVALKAKVNNKYARGMRDALAFCLGKLGPGEFHDDWVKHAKQNGMYQTDRPKAPKAQKPTPAKSLVAKTAKRRS